MPDTLKSLLHNNEISLKFSTSTSEHSHPARVFKRARIIFLETVSLDFFIIYDIDEPILMFCFTVHFWQCVFRCYGILDKET